MTLTEAQAITTQDLAAYDAKSARACLMLADRHELAERHLRAVARDCQQRSRELYATARMLAGIIEE